MEMEAKMNQKNKNFINYGVGDGFCIDLKRILNAIFKNC